MEQDQNISLKNVAKYAQVLLSDGIFVKSEDKNIASIERKNLVKQRP